MIDMIFRCDFIIASNAAYEMCVYTAFYVCIPKFNYSYKKKILYF